MKDKKKICFKNILWMLFLTVYFPVYLASYLLQKVARALLAASYFGLLDFEYGKDTLRFLFGNDYETPGDGTR